jgi:hypothetical protein
MRAAYAAAGVQPSEISLLECHATGTAVGDAVEARSAARVFAGAADIPIGSLKSNFGHAVTAAGIAGLLKVIARCPPARPPRFTSTSRWRSSTEPLRPCARQSRGRARRAPGRRERLRLGAPTPPHRRRTRGVSALFAPPRERAQAGRPRRTSSRFPSPWSGSAPPPARERRWRRSTPRTDEPSRDLDRAPVVGTRFPPNDTAVAAAADTTLAVAREALAELRRRRPACRRRDRDRAPGGGPVWARWRLPDIAAAWGVTDEAWIRRAADIMSPVLSGAGVLGTMPNLPANRLNVQFNLAGPGFTISAEELSGVERCSSLRALRSGELDLALAGPPISPATRCTSRPRSGPAGTARRGAVVFALAARRRPRDGDRIRADRRGDRRRRCGRVGPGCAR